MRKTRRIRALGERREIVRESVRVCLCEEKAPLVLYGALLTPNIYIYIRFLTLTLTNSIMDMMKDMYDSGDDQTRKAIGEAMMKSRSGEKVGPPDVGDMEM